MKKYNRLIVIFVILYCFMALLAFFVIANGHKSREQYHKVEINRLMKKIAEEKEIDENIDCSQYQTIKHIAFLQLAETKRERIEEFYGGRNGLNSAVIPLYVNDRLEKYVRFDYEEKQPEQGVLIGAECILFGMAAMSLVIMLYIKRHIIIPFCNMQDMAYDLSKGNLYTEVKAEKNQYLGKFLWGINQLKDTLYISRKRELELLKEKKLLLFSLSHDIKTPINTIKLYSRALREGLYPFEEKQMYVYKKIEEKAQQIEKYVGEIVKAFGEDFIHIQVEQGEYYLGDLIHKVISVYGEKCALKKCELSVGEFQNRLYKGDFHRLVEVFENIFENAFKYGDGRRIEISFYEEDYCQLIRIFNTGQPVAQNDFAHLFDSFYRGENTNGRQGNGLGLYICREIMHKTGGEIFAEMEEDGMAFTIVLPM